MPHPTRRDPAPLLATLLLSLTAAAALHLSFASRAAPERAAAASASRLDGAARRLESLVQAAQDAATRVAAWPEARAALAGDRRSLARLFTRLELERARRPDAPALAIHDAGLATVAWAGPVEARRPLSGAALSGDGVFLAAGRVSSTLVAAAEIREGDNLRGIVTAEIPLSTRRGIRNEFLGDFDRVAGADEGLEVRYVDVLESDHPVAAEPRSRLLLSPAGRTLAVARVIDDGAAGAVRRVAISWRRILSGLAAAAILVWVAGQPRPRRIAAGATLLRLSLLLLGPPFPGPDSVLAGADLFSSPALGPLGRSPVDLLLTTLWLAT
ncbi:MAG TPA: hypothetical protein VFM88_18035, partial [Vicinamibacteria bacterium]|nr:hypothetical protein [Vicinamibacteria bacterium]